MIGALIILAVTIAVGVLLWAWEKWRAPHHGNTLHHHHASPREEEEGAEAAASSDKNTPEVCCGLHAICEKTGAINEPPVYYDDEELDRFAGRNPEEYTDSEIEEFRDVMLTLRRNEVAPWTVSLEKRHLSLPAPLVPELELLLSEN